MTAMLAKFAAKKKEERRKDSNARQVRSKKIKVRELYSSKRRSEQAESALWSSLAPPASCSRSRTRTHRILLSAGGLFQNQDSFCLEEIGKTQP